MQGDELVLDHAHAHGREERSRTAGLSVQEVQDGVATARTGRVAGREIDVDLLAPPAEGRARHRDRLLGPLRRDVGRVARLREAAIQPVGVEVAIDAEGSDRSEDDGPERQAQGSERSRATRRCEHRETCNSGCAAAAGPPLSAAVRSD